jgi:hypothetical protein
MGDDRLMQVALPESRAVAIAPQVLACTISIYLDRPDVLPAPGLLPAGHTCLLRRSIRAGPPRHFYSGIFFMAMTASSMYHFSTSTISGSAPLANNQPSTA